MVLSFLAMKPSRLETTCRVMVDVIGVRPPSCFSFELPPNWRPRGGAQGYSDLERATERPAGIVRLRTVVIQEDAAEAAIAKQGAAELSHRSRCFHPTRRLGIETSELL